MIETDTSPKFSYCLMAPTSSETVGISATVVPGSLFDRLRNATWITDIFPVRVATGLDRSEQAGGPKTVKASDLGWTKAQVASLRARQASFREEWNAPGMEDYNDL